MRIFVCALACLLFSGCSSVSYLLDAGIGQWKLMNRARPIEDVLNNPNVDEKTKQAIRLIQEVKKFSVEELQLKATSNYNTFVKLDGAYASYVVTAAHPFKLEPKRWHFPIVGDIPYIGFFEEKKALDFLEKFKADKDNWYKFADQEFPPDMNMRGASAYSTLGWLPDPLYSSMISASERRMVEVVIHESVHATVFIGSNMDFNERLANFIGLEGSLFYMRKKYGEASEAYIQTQAALANDKIFARFIDEASTRFAKEVEPDFEKNPKAALERKVKFYANLGKVYTEMHTRMKSEWPKLNPQPWNINFQEWNNAVLVGHRTYNADSSVFQRLLGKCNNDVKLLMLWIIDEYDKNKSTFKENPEAYIQMLAKEKTCLNSKSVN